jgi:anti-sigma regulatory factor (Ser/Thr protein kinase)
VTLEPLHRTVPARPEVIGQLRAELVDYAESAGVANPHGLALAVSETVTNVIVHAYVGLDPGEIEVRAETRGGAVQLTISDHGRGMMPRPDSPGLGLGLPLIAHFSDRFEICDAPDGGTSIQMAFALAG